jgi:hypothetical protein
MCGVVDGAMARMWMWTEVRWVGGETAGLGEGVDYRETFTTILR